MEIISLQQQGLEGIKFCLRFHKVSLDSSIPNYQVKNSMSTCMGYDFVKQMKLAVH